MCIEEALAEAGLARSKLQRWPLPAVLVWLGALLVGLAAAKSLPGPSDIPLIPVNHMAGHLMAAQSVEPLEFPLAGSLSQRRPY